MYDVNRRLSMFDNKFSMYIPKSKLGISYIDERIEDKKLQRLRGLGIGSRLPEAQTPFGNQAKLTTAQTSIGQQFKIQDMSKSISNLRLVSSPQTTPGNPQEVGNRAAVLQSMVGLTSMAAAGTAAAAVMGPLAIAAFAIAAISRINAAKKQRKAIKKAIKAEVNLQKQRNALFKNRMGLENLALNDTLNQVERQALKNRTTFQAAKGETLSGTTFRLLQQAMRKNELEYKERLKSANAQKRINMREDQVQKYYASNVKISQLAAQNPSNGDIAMGIASDAMNSVMSYYGAVGFPGSQPVAGNPTDFYAGAGTPPPELL